MTKMKDFDLTALPIVVMDLDDNQNGIELSSCRLQFLYNTAQMKRVQFLYFSPTKLKIVSPKLHRITFSNG